MLPNSNIKNYRTEIEQTPPIGGVCFMSTCARFDAYESYTSPLSYYSMYPYAFIS